MKIFSIFVLVLYLSIGTVFSQKRESIDSIKHRLSDFEVVSMIQLIANPKSFNGKRVQLSGFMHLKFEDCALYLSRDDANYLRSENALWLDFVETPHLETLQNDSIRSLSYYDGKYVVIRGTYNYNNQGHLGAFSGAIEDIYYIFEARQWYNGKQDILIKTNYYKEK
jgi:hypothetical protein